MSICLLVLATTAIPSLPLYAGIAFSLTPGFVLLALVVMAMRATGGKTPLHTLAANGLQRYRTAFIVMLIVALHFAIAAFRGPTNIPRALGSFVPLALLLLASADLANEFASVGYREFHRGMLRAYAVMGWLGVAGVLNLAPPALTEWRKPVFPFSEPSVYALALIPILIYVTATTSSWQRRLLRLLLAVALAILLQNLTLLVGCLIAAAVSLSWRLFGLVAVLALLAAGQLDLTYYAERIGSSEDTQNLSNLVYIQGWQMIGESLQRSHGFGTGFQQLGVFGTDVPISDVLRSLRQGEDMNLLDGSFVFAKVGSDFGVAGILVTLVFLGFAARSFFTLRRIARRVIRTEPAVCLAHAAIVAYPVELFVRGSGYFTGSSLLLFTALWLRRRRRRRSSGVAGSPATRSELATVS